ncbi:PH domain-containing protein [Corynebacterium sp.]|uniref:PH domain-containing protein n=1 Tax=Corynebacterium sp. TaxID=1720 RepID=UPI0025BC6DFE|nr:PH domain-containing protein [Corynebacterium sp.]
MNRTVPKITFAPDEEVLAELSPSRRSTLFPVLELVVITGLVWLAVGMLDSYLAELATTWVGYVPGNIGDVPALVGDSDSTAATAALWARRAVLLAWAWLSWRRCLRHLLFRTRSRMILTDSRLITATGHMRSRIGEVPLSQIVDVGVHKSEVRVFLRGGGRPLVLRDVPYARRFARLLHSRIPVRLPRPLY